MNMQNIKALTEESLIPAIISECFPEMRFDLSTNLPNRSWYGFVYNLPIKPNPKYQTPNLNMHGPAILRLEHGSIIIIDQDRSWKFSYEKHCTCMRYVQGAKLCVCAWKPIKKIPICENFADYKHLIDQQIVKWIAYHNELCWGCNKSVRNINANRNDLWFRGWVG